MASPTVPPPRGSDNRFMIGALLIAIVLGLAGAIDADRRVATLAAAIADHEARLQHLEAAIASFD